jgi:hypothetical protein
MQAARHPGQRAAHDAKHGAMQRAGHRACGVLLHDLEGVGLVTCGAKYTVRAACEAAALMSCPPPPSSSSGVTRACTPTPCACTPYGTPGCSPMSTRLAGPMAARRPSYDSCRAWAARGHGSAGYSYVGMQAVLHRATGLAAQGCGPSRARAMSRPAEGSGCSGAAPGAQRRRTGRLERSPGMVRRGGERTAARAQSEVLASETRDV